MPNVYWKMAKSHVCRRSLPFLAPTHVRLVEVAASHARAVWEAKGVAMPHSNGPALTRKSRVDLVAWIWLPALRESFRVSVAGERSVWPGCEPGSVMSYALVQKELVVPDIDRLKRAFSASPLLTALDAQTAVKDAYGILLRGQELEHATMLQEALRREQIETHLIAESTLPVLPIAHVMRELEFLPDRLKITDPMQRAMEVPYADFLLVIAGYVKIREIRKHRATLEEPASRSAGIGQDLVSGFSSREEEHPHLLLDLYLRNGGRYSLDADAFSYDCLGDRRTEDKALNFVALIQTLIQAAPNAGQNQGAYMACQDPPELFPFPSKAAFNEETIWMLWRIAQQGTGVVEGPAPTPPAGGVSGAAGLRLD